MGKRLAAALICVLALAATGWGAAEKPELRDAGIYDVTYEIDGAGALSVKSLRLLSATQEVIGRPGIAFGVCAPLVEANGLPLQAGFRHPEDTRATGRFWGVETGFRQDDSAPMRFYGFVFEEGTTPVPGLYAIRLYRPDDGSLVASQGFKIIPEPPAPEEQAAGQAAPPASGGDER